MKIFLRVYWLCYKSGTALRRFSNNLVKCLHWVLNPLAVKANFEEVDFTHCATLIALIAVVNKSGGK